MIAIQEPWKNSTVNTTYYPCGQYFDLVYLDELDIRTCFLVNKRISNAKWATSLHSRDLITIIVTCINGSQIHVHNVYNPPKDTGQSTVPLLREVLTGYTGDIQIVVGDFNLHYPMWSGMGDLRHNDEAEDLLRLMGEH